MQYQKDMTAFGKLYINKDYCYLRFDVTKSSKIATENKWFTVYLILA